MRRFNTTKVGYYDTICTMYGTPELCYFIYGMMLMPVIASFRVIIYAISSPTEPAASLLAASAPNLQLAVIGVGFRLDLPRFLLRSSLRGRLGWLLCILFVVLGDIRFIAIGIIT